MAKLTIKSETTLNEVLGKLTPSWEKCFTEDTITRAQIAKSSARKFMFGNIFNAKFIELTKACAGFKKGDIVSLTDIYVDDTASNIVGLIIWRLGNPGGLVCQPKVVKA